MNGLYLQHHGILGMKWGVRRYQNKDGTYTDEGKKRREYKSRGIGAMIARHRNAKIDASFKKWKEGSANRDAAIEKGKAASAARIAYEMDRGNQDLKQAYKVARKEYKQAYRKNTAYRKGTVRQEVGGDLSRRYLSEAKRVEKELQKNPYDEKLQKQYDHLMSRHDVERARAGRAQKVGAKRSYAIASVKRGMTMTVKGAVATAAVGAGIIAANKYIFKGNLRMDSDTFIVGLRRARQMMGSIYF